jgi:hypothetical protein
MDTLAHSPADDLLSDFALARADLIAARRAQQAEETSAHRVAVSRERSRIDAELDHLELVIPGAGTSINCPHSGRRALRRPDGSRTRSSRRAGPLSTSVRRGRDRRGDCEAAGVDHRDGVVGLGA